MSKSQLRRDELLYLWLLAGFQKHAERNVCARTKSVNTMRQKMLYKSDCILFWF